MRIIQSTQLNLDLLLSRRGQPALDEAKLLHFISLKAGGTVARFLGSENNVLLLCLREGVKVEKKCSPFFVKWVGWGVGSKRSFSHFLFYAQNGLIRPEIQRFFSTLTPSLLLS